VSVKVQSKVWEHSRASGNTLVVLLKIADNCDDSGRNAWPSIPTLARYCRCSESTVKRSIRELVELGEIEVVTNGGGREPGSRYAPNLYRVVLEGYQNDPLRSGRGGSSVAAREAEKLGSGGSPLTRNSFLEPSENPPTESNKELAATHLAIARRSLGVGRGYRNEGPR
jgi:hypothetical protein